MSSTRDGRRPRRGGPVNAAEHDGGRNAARQGRQRPGRRRASRPAASNTPEASTSRVTRARSADGERPLVLEPRPHAGLRDGFGDARRRQPGGVVLDVQALRHDVGVERFEAGQPLQRALEDRDFLVAVHPLDLEHRLGVELADGAGGHRAPPSSTCVSASRSSSMMCWSSSA